MDGPAELELLALTGTLSEQHRAPALSIGSLQRDEGFLRPRGALEEEAVHKHCSTFSCVCEIEGFSVNVSVCVYYERVYGNYTHV